MGQNYFLAELYEFNTMFAIRRKREFPMKSRNAAVLLGILIVFTACDIPSRINVNTYDNQNSNQIVYSLQEFKNAGRKVAAQKWTDDYDCSNFAVQFYQNCYKAGLPSRIRVGISGGDFSVPEGHAWNSVKINGKWVDWEPQLNEVYSGHKQTVTPIVVREVVTQFTNEGIFRMMYELVGRNVPQHIINTHEIDTFLYNNSPFNQYFNGYCLSDDPAYSVLVNMLRMYIQNNGDGIITLSGDYRHIMFIYKLGGKYYGIDRLEENDPVEGRSAFGRNRLTHDFTTATEFITPDINLK